MPVYPGAFVAVGTALAGGPPHRSQRAGLPHWAPTLGGWRRSAPAGRDASCGRVVATVSRGGSSASQFRRVRWLRRRSALQCQVTWARKAITAWRCRARRSRPCALAPRWPATGPARGWADAGVASAGFDLLELGPHPLRDRDPPHPEAPVPCLPADVREAEEVERLRLTPARAPVRAACRPNSISRVLSGCSSSPNFANRSRRSARNRSASSRCSNPTMKSSANRTMITSPCAWRVLHQSAHRSRT